MTDDLHLIQITDTHLLAQPDQLFVGVNPEQHFQAILTHIQQQPHITAILHTGDIAQHATADVYQRYLQHMHRLNIPFYHTLGNHDDPTTFPFLGHAPTDIQCIRFPHWQIILLNSAVVGRVDGQIPPHQLQQLNAHLTQSNKHTLVALHHHPHRMQSHWIDEHRLKNNDAFLSILSQHQHVKLCIFGHVHQEFHKLWQGISFFATPAVSVQFKPLSDDFAMANTPPAYRSLILKATGEFETQLHFLEHFQSIDVNCAGY